MSPSEETGIVRNVLNHMSLGAYTGFTTSINIEDLKRLCWVWEWDGKTLPSEGLFTTFLLNMLLQRTEIHATQSRSQSLLRNISLAYCHRRHIQSPPWELVKWEEQ